jgi:hypothetical protein
MTTVTLEDAQARLPELIEQRPTGQTSSLPEESSRLPGSFLQRWSDRSLGSVAARAC